MSGFNIGFIKLYRSFTDWEWYHNNNVKVLFIHMLLSVNYEDRNWQGINICKGQFITSINNLARQTNLSIQQVRTSLNKLKCSGEISVKSTNKFTIITVNNFNKFQNADFDFLKHYETVTNKSIGLDFKHSDNSNLINNINNSFDITSEIKHSDNNQITFDKHSNNFQLTTNKEYNNNNNINNIRNVYQYITDMYNKICVSFPKCTKLSNNRIKAIKSRLRKFSLDDFETLFNKAQCSDYLKGANNYNWSANFDWLIADKNFVKVIDGNYDNNINSFNNKNNINNCSGNIFIDIARDEGIF